MINYSGREPASGTDDASTVCAGSLAASDRRHPTHQFKTIMATELSRRFDEQALAVYENGKRELRYNGTRFLQKIRSAGGVAAAKSWLRPARRDKPTNGFLELVDFGKLELSLEALVLREPWNSLFTEDELEVARRRLTKYGYFVPAGQSRLRTGMLAEQVDGETYPEGAVQPITVNRYERSEKARAACVDHYGSKCYVCGFDFSAVYGPDFFGFIHVHHLCELSAIGEEYQVDPIADLRPVCPNCHAVIHSRTPCLRIEEVRRMLTSGRK